VVEFAPAERIEKPMPQSGMSTNREEYPGKPPDLVYGSTIRLLREVWRRTISQTAPMAVRVCNEAVGLHPAASSGWLYEGGAEDASTYSGNIVG
jgi:hypothetical protein